MTLQVPKVFVAGTKAKANEVNENFTACQDAINSNISNISNNTSLISALSDNALKIDGSNPSNKLQSYQSFTITNATNATPIVVTASKHGRLTGEKVYIEGVEGNTAANGAWTITVIDSNTLSLNNSSGNASYISGGTFYMLPQKPENITSKVYVDNKVSGYLPQNYIDGLTLSCNSTTLTGTVANTASSATLTGTGTLFTTEAPVGTILLINGISYTVTAVASNTSLTLSATIAGASSGVTAYKIMNSITVGTGVCSDSANTAKMSLTSAITKKLDTVWASGSGNGGLDSGTKSINTWYHVFLISKSDGTTDSLYSLSATAPTLPGGYSYFRRIGSIKTDANGNIRQFIQKGDKFLWTSLINDLYTTVSISYTNLVVSAPPNSMFLGHADLRWTGETSTVYLYVRSTDGYFGRDVAGTAWGSNSISDFFIPVDSLSRISYATALTYGGYVNLYSLGYIDSRGKN